MGRVRGDGGHEFSEIFLVRKAFRGGSAEQAFAHECATDSSVLMLHSDGHRDNHGFCRTELPKA